MRTIKVLHIIQGKHFGGAERVVFTLAKSFDQGAVLPSVLCLSEGLLLNKLREANLNSFHIPMDSRADIISPLIKTIRLIRREKIDIVHTHTVRSNLIGRLAALLSGRKCVSHLHSPVLRDFADMKRGRLNERIDSLTRPLASLFIAVSNSLRDEMIKGGMPRNKIVTVHNAIDPDSLRSRSGENAGIREKYSIPGNAFLIVMVALLRPRKGPDLLIKAMKKVLEHRPDTFLLLVGNDDISEEPGYGDKLARMAVELGIKKNVIFTGFRKDVHSILGECDLMVLPSRFGEGLPMTILEAMAAGVPVIASRVEGVPEVLEEAHTGFLVNPGDAGDLSEKLVSVIKDPVLLRRVAEKARDHVLKNHECHSQAGKIGELYRQVLSR